MATEVKVPAMGESISSGVLAAWHVKDGDFVEANQVLYELETDKITSEAHAEVSGAISLKANEGDEVEIGQTVAVIDEKAEASAGGSGSAPEAPSAESEEPATGQKASETQAASAPAAAAAGEAGKSAAAETTAAPQDAPAGTPLSPAARKAAEETGVDLSRVEGTGKGGRITKSDILAASEAGAGSASGSGAGQAAETPPSGPSRSPQQTETAAPAGNERETRKKMSPLRRKIAQRLVAATREAALLTTFNEVDMSAVSNLRKKHQDSFVETHGIKLGFMSFFVKAATRALQAVPAVNARLEGEEVVSQHYYHIGVAVGTEKGLMVPVVRDCDQKNFARIESDILDYAKAAREGTIQLADLEGGVFTISNGGIYGSMLSTPIINYPQPAILGLHNITQRPVAVDGEVVIRPMMYLALSYDHRLIDGKEAVTFLNTIKHAIEEPERLLLDI